MTKISGLILFLMASPALATMPPFQTKDTATNANFEDIYRQHEKHLHDNDGSGRLHDVLPETDSTFDIGALGREWQRGYFDSLNTSTITASSATLTSLSASSVAASTITASSATLTNLTATTATLTNLSVSSNASVTGSLSFGMASGLFAGANRVFNILQISTGTSTTEFTTTSNSFQATNLSASITPKSTSSKILVFATGVLFCNSAGASGYATLARGGTNLLAASGGAEIRSSSTSAIQAPMTLLFFDSPASTSAQTYDVRIRNSDAASTVGFSDESGTQFMVLIEVLQ